MQEMFQKIIDSLRGAVPKILFAAFVLVVGFIVIKLLVKLLKKALGRFELDPSLIGFFVKATNIVLFVVLILCALAILGVPTTGMIAAMSAAAVAVSLALKDSLSNIAQGILLLISHPFSTGDFVEVGGVSGSVMEVDMLQTTLRTADNRKVIIPNSQVATSEIINYSSETERRVEVVFPISYNDDVEKAKALIVKIAERWSADEPLVISTSEAAELKAFFAAKAKVLLDKGVEIKQVNGVKTSISIAPADGSYKVNFGEGEFEAFFKSFLRPQMVELLFS